MLRLTRINNHSSAAVYERACICRSHSFQVARFPILILEANHNQGSMSDLARSFHPALVPPSVLARAIDSEKRFHRIVRKVDSACLFAFNLQLTNLKTRI